MKQLFLFLLAGTFSLLTACEQTPTKPDNTTGNAADQLIQPADNLQYYYAIGSGLDTEKAKNDALAQIASKISVKVQSNLNTNLTVTKTNEAEDISSTYSKDVQAQSKSIEFVGAEILDTQKISKVETQTLVRVDRNRLFQHYNNTFNQQESELLNSYKINQKLSLFERLKGEAAIQKQMVDTQATLSLLQTIKPDFAVQPHQKQYQKINNTFKAERNQAVFLVDADRNSIKLMTLVKDKLSDKSFKLTNVSQRANIRLSIRTESEQKHYRSTDARVASLKIALRTTSFVVKEDSKIVSNNVIKTKGVDKDSYHNAILETKAYARQIEQHGIIGFLAGGQ